MYKTIDHYTVYPHCLPTDFKMSYTINPANNSIYQALLDKAVSYPADKPYQTKAYMMQAEVVATYPVDIYDMTHTVSNMHPVVLQDVLHYPVVKLY